MKKLSKTSKNFRYTKLQLLDPLRPISEQFKTNDHENNENCPYFNFNSYG